MSRSDAYNEGYLAELARQVAKGFGRDKRVTPANAHPGALSARLLLMDAEAVGTASAGELATAS